MRIVIQCAARKQQGAPSLVAADGRPILFVAHPEMAPPRAACVYARPDDISDDGRTWRRRLLDYNDQESGANPLGLLPAWRLYSPGAYRALVERFGVGRVHVISAGWGLIPAGFLTPDYGITFTAKAVPWMRRLKGDAYDDSSIIPDDGDEIVFLGCSDYLPLFCRLTEPLMGGKRVFFRSVRTPDLPPRFRPVRYATRARTNWHYECARALAAGEIVLADGQ